MLRLLTFSGLFSLLFSASPLIHANPPAPAPTLTLKERMNELSHLEHQNSQTLQEYINKIKQLNKLITSSTEEGALPPIAQVSETLERLHPLQHRITSAIGTSLGSSLSLLDDLQTRLNSVRNEEIRQIFLSHASKLENIIRRERAHMENVFTETYAIQELIYKTALSLDDPQVRTFSHRLRQYGAILLQSAAWTSAISLFHWFAAGVFDPMLSLNTFSGVLPFVAVSRVIRRRVSGYDAAQWEALAHRADELFSLNRFWRSFSQWLTIPEGSETQRLEWLHEKLDPTIAPQACELILTPASPLSQESFILTLEHWQRNNLN